MQSPLRASALRALGGHANVFAIESFMDELALAAGADPVDFRLRHLKDARARAVIETVAQKSGWNKNATADGRGRGIGFARYKNLAAYCAIAAEAELESRGLARDHAISSISLISGAGGNLCYVAEVEPPILSPADPAAQTRLAFQVEMDGRVMAKQIDPKYQRGRRFKSN
jgi:hypothetical protein